MVQILLYFSKNYLPQNFSALAHFSNDVEKLFLVLLSLGDFEIRWNQLQWWHELY